MFPQEKRWEPSWGWEQHSKSPSCWTWTCNSCSRLLCLVFRWWLKSYNMELSRFVLHCALCDGCRGSRLRCGKEQLGDADCGERVGMRMEGILGKLCQNKRLFKLRLDASWKCCSKTNQTNTRSSFYLPEFKLLWLSGFLYSSWNDLVLNQHPNALCCLGLSPKGAILDSYSQANPACGSGVKVLSSHAIEKLFKSAEGVTLKWIASTALHLWGRVIVTLILEKSIWRRCQAV